MKTLPTDLPVVDDLQALFLSDTPLLDVRAPVEFAQGAFPHTANLPLMNDAERNAVGKRYKQQGQDAAIALGMQLVSGEIKTERAEHWAKFARDHPEGVLYCFRGGLRSRISQQWLYEQSGVRYPRVKGGYKAMRRFLLKQLESLPAQLQPIVISGRTGSGKTRFLRAFQQQIDLEALANHRGSAFGVQPTPQPAQISFENALAVQLLRHMHKGHEYILFEDESRSIGSLHVPDALFQALSQAPLALLRVDNEPRVQISYQEYVVDTSAAFERLLGSREHGFQAFSQYLLGSLAKIQKRLGGVRYQHARAMMQEALYLQERNGMLEGHQEWVRFILLDYYDPMYDYQISQKQERIIFSGAPEELQAYLAGRNIR